MLSTLMAKNQRLWVGLAVALVLSLLIIYGGNWVVASMFGVIALAVGWEWAKLIQMPRQSLYLTLLLLMLLLVTIGFSAWYLPQSLVAESTYWLIYLAAVWWAVMFFLVAAYRVEWLQTVWLGWLFKLGLPIVISSAWLAAVELHRIDYRLLLYLIALVAAVDTSAYYCGRRWGREKLIPELSPGKSYAGLWGGLAGALLLAVIATLIFGRSWLDGLYLILLSLFIALVCIVGDLSESMLKRRNDVKDSGTWLPGHGGVLDRADSFLAAAVWFFLFTPSHFG